MFGMRLATATLLLLFLSSHVAMSASIGFMSAQNYPVGTAPGAVVTGDFNGDGKLDLGVANFGDPGAGNDGGVSILLGNGDGTFQAAANFAAGKNPPAIAAGDFNGDNRLDLAVINSDGGTGNVGILLGNGNGTFQTPVDYPTGKGPIAVAVGDFNRDDKLDLVVTNVFDGTVSILLGNGDGTFEMHADYSTGGLAGEVAIADFNGDGKPDIAVAGVFSGVAILLGDGDGTFESSALLDRPIGMEFGPTSIVVGDFDSDGKLDVIVDFLAEVNPPIVARRLDLLKGDGAGRFRLIKSVIAQVNDARVSQADFDGDAKLDLVQPNGAVWPGNGDGTFQPAVGFPVGTFPGGLVSVDLDGNKSPDIVFANQGDNNVSVLLNMVGTDFSISASALTPGTVSGGQSATSTLTLNLLNTFDNPVSLSCTVLPAQAGSPGCAFSPNPALFDSAGNSTSQLTVTAGATARSARSSPWRWVWAPVAGFALLGMARGSSRRGTLHLLSTLVFSALLLQAACGGGGGGGPSSTTYTITVLGTSGSTQQSTKLTLTVN